MQRPFMVSDLWRLGAGVCSLVLMIVSCSGCGDRSEPAIAARTDVFAITEAELADWTPVLEGKRELRGRLRKAEDRREELLRVIAMIRLVPPEYGGLVPATELESAQRDLEARQVRTAYRDQVLRPQIEVTEEEIRQIFTEYRQNYQKPEAVRVLEIFKWAPPDLPDLRRQRTEEMESLRSKISDRESFEEAALAYSDATSAHKGGRIGTLNRDEVSGVLEEALFSGGYGLTEVVASGSGLYLFFVVDRLPPRANELSDVADGIEKSLVRQRLQRLMAENAARLKNEYGFRLVPANKTDDGQPRLRIGNEVLTAEQLGVSAGLSEESKIKRIEQRGLTIIMKKELARRAVVPPPTVPMETDWMRYRLAWRRVVVTELSRTPPGRETLQDDAERPPNVERWSFDLIRVPAGEGAEAWDAAFRVCREIQPEAGLEPIRQRLAQDYGLVGELVKLRDVTSREAGPLGPEIHTTIKKILEPGEISQPLFLADRGEVVVIQLHSKRVDPEASAAAAQRRDRNRHRRAVEERLERDLLDRHGFLIEPN